MTDGAGPALDAEAVRAAAAAAGIDLTESDLVTVAGFLAALQPGLEALSELGRSTSSDDDEHVLSTTFSVEWE